MSSAARLALKWLLPISLSTLTLDRQLMPVRSFNSSLLAAWTPLLPQTTRQPQQKNCGPRLHGNQCFDPPTCASSSSLCFASSSASSSASLACSTSARPLCSVADAVAAVKACACDTPGQHHTTRDSVEMWGEKPQDEHSLQACLTGWQCNPVQDEAGLG